MGGVVIAVLLVLMAFDIDFMQDVFLLHHERAPVVCINSWTSIIFTPTDLGFAFSFSNTTSIKVFFVPEHGKKRYLSCRNIITRSLYDKQRHLIIYHPHQRSITFALCYAQ